MADRAAQERLREALAAVPLIDTHEHLDRETERIERGVDFGYLFMHYAASDLVSAGMPPADLVLVQAPGGDEDEKWRRFAPWWVKARNTAYSKAVLLALCELYEIDDLNERTYRAVGEAMRAATGRGQYRRVFQRAGIEKALWNNRDHRNLTTTTSSNFLGRDLGEEPFIQDMVDVFIAGEVETVEKELGVAIRTLDDLLAAVDGLIDRFADRVAAYKIGSAYHRSLDFAEVSRSEAKAVFKKHGEKKLRFRTMERPYFFPAETKALEDYVFHHIVRAAMRHDLPIKIHTGLQEGNANDIRNSRVTDLIPVFLRYPEARFDIYHIGWPYDKELAAIAKNFRNVAIDMCWMWVISPTEAGRALQTFLETVPANKIFGFGGDYVFIEGTYAHARIAREGITRALARKVDEGYLDEEEALRIGKGLFRENAIDFFRLREKKLL
ncbi:MAG: amidohydrolase family protein [Planctomycetota bacterium]